MDIRQQIEAIKTGLAALDSAIAQTEAALRTASNPDDLRSLTSALVDLRSERTRLQAQLDNLEAASVEVQTSALATTVTPLHKSLEAALLDRSVVSATLAFAQSVHDQAKRLRSAGAESTETLHQKPKRAPAKKRR